MIMILIYTLLSFHSNAFSRLTLYIGIAFANRSQIAFNAPLTPFTKKIDSETKRKENKHATLANDNDSHSHLQYIGSFILCHCL